MVIQFWIRENMEQQRINSRCQMNYASSFEKSTSMKRNKEIDEEEKKLKGINCIIFLKWSNIWNKKRNLGYI